jgi:cytochrome c553
MKSTPGFTVCILLLSAVVTAACSRAETVEIPARAVTCSACHGGNGMQTAPAVPRLAGQNAIYLSRQLRAYRDGERKDPVMSSLAQALSDEEIDSLSAWYESLDPCLAAK